MITDILVNNILNILNEPSSELAQEYKNKIAENIGDNYYNPIPDKDKRLINKILFTGSVEYQSDSKTIKLYTPEVIYTLAGKYLVLLHNANLLEALCYNYKNHNYCIIDISSEELEPKNYLSSNDFKIVLKAYLETLEQTINNDNIERLVELF